MPLYRCTAQAAGLPITKMGLYSFFINRARSYLHLVLCFRCVGGEDLNFEPMGRVSSSLTAHPYNHPLPTH